MHGISPYFDKRLLLKGVSAVTYTSVFRNSEISTNCKYSVQEHCDGFLIVAADLDGQELI